MDEADKKKAAGAARSWSHTVRPDEEHSSADLSSGDLYSA